MCQTHPTETVTSRRDKVRAFPVKWSQRASSISGVILRGRPARIEGALVSPNCRKLLRIVVTERGLHSAASAIWAVVSDLLKIISRMNSRVEEGRFGAILCRGCSSRGSGVKVVLKLRQLRITYNSRLRCIGLVRCFTFPL